MSIVIIFCFRILLSSVIDKGFFYVTFSFIIHLIEFNLLIHLFPIVYVQHYTEYVYLVQTGY